MATVITKRLPPVIPCALQPAKICFQVPRGPVIYLYRLKAFHRPEGGNALPVVPAKVYHAPMGIKAQHRVVHPQRWP